MLTKYENSSPPVLGRGSKLAVSAPIIIIKWSPNTHRIIREMSKQLFDSSRDQRDAFFFGQQISIFI